LIGGLTDLRVDVIVRSCILLGGGMRRRSEVDDAAVFSVATGQVFDV
jgi:hypothetical protein